MCLSVLPTYLTAYYLSVFRGQKKAMDPLELEGQFVSFHVVLGIEPGSFGRAASVLNIGPSS